MLLHEATYRYSIKRSRKLSSDDHDYTSSRASGLLEWASTRHCKYILVIIMFEIIIIFATTQDRMYTQGQQ